MGFNTVHGNPQHNLHLDRSCPEKFDRLELVSLPRYAGEKALAIHEAGDRLVFYTGSAVQIYSSDLVSQALIGSLPPGDAVLFTEDGAWATHDGPVRRYGQDFKPDLEEYVVPHGGPWTASLGLFVHGPTVAMAYVFCGGPREWAPELQLNAGSLGVGPGSGAPAAGAPPPGGRPAPKDRLSVPVKLSRPGDVESMVQLGDLLFAGGERGLAVFRMNGALVAETPLPEGIFHLAASTTLQAVGGFCRLDGRWIYREFDLSGREVFDFTLSGAASPGRAVFDPDGSRYLASEKRLVKLGPDGQRQWSHTLRGGSKESPRLLAFQGGRCAYMDGCDFILLDASGVEQLRLPLPVRKVISPPYLDSQGVFWLGLAGQKEMAVKVHLKP
jgi:hypothetical protein